VTTTPPHAPQSAPTPTAPARGPLLRALLASASGSLLTWYDFFLYAFAAGQVVGRVFFPAGDPLSSQLMALATVVGGVAARPVGAALFGHLGDRIGRRATLIATLGLMGLATALVGTLPAGAIGAALLVLLRLAQGLAAGGQWAGSVLLSLECRPSARDRRGFLGSWTQAGLPAGLALAYGALQLSTTLLGADSYWGWRLPFLAGVLPLAVALFARLAAAETPVFKRLLQERWVEPAPVLTVIARQWREVLLTGLVRTGQQAGFTVFTVVALTYATETLGLARDLVVLFVVAGAGLAAVATPPLGFLSDVVGRRWLILAGAVLMLLWAYPAWLLLDTRAPLLVAAAIVAGLLIHDLQLAPQAALIGESFTPRLRYSGAALGYELATLTAAAPAPLAASLLLHRFNSSPALAALLAAYTLVGLVALLSLRDRSRLDLTFEHEEPVGEVRQAVSRQGAPAGPGPR